VGNLLSLDKLTVKEIARAVSETMDFVEEIREGLEG